MNSNTLPDLRECTLVGIGTSSRSILSQTGHSHDTYTLGQFKDDCIQNITGKLRTRGLYTNAPITEALNFGEAFYDNGRDSTEIAGVQPEQNVTYKGFFISFDASRVARTSTSTHGKQVGVNYIIKY